MATTRENVQMLLRGYQKAKRRIEILLYEQKHVIAVSAQEVLEALALRPPQSSGLPTSNLTSDDTMWIATDYREITRRLNEEYICSVGMELTGLIMTYERLERYVNLLSGERKEIIQLHYFAGKTWLQMQQQLKRAKRTLTETNAHAIDELAEMYAYVDTLKSSGGASSLASEQEIHLVTPTTEKRDLT